MKPIKLLFFNALVAFCAACSDSETSTSKVPNEEMIDGVPISEFPASMRDGHNQKLRVEKYFKYMTKIQNAEREVGRLCSESSSIKSYKVADFPSDTRLLVFEFPDGVMGGRGKIIGRRQPNTLSDAQCGVLKFEICARVQFYEDNNWDHMSFIVTPSSASDKEVVSCAVEHLAGHFNIGYSSSDPMDFGRMDEAPFKHLQHAEADK